MRTEPSHANQLNARWCYYRSRAQKSYRAVEIRGPELDVEVERRGASRHGPRGRDPALGGVGLGVGPRGAAADEARADEDDEGGTHPEADHRGHQIQPRPQHLPPQHLSPTAQHQQEKRKKKKLARAQQADQAGVRGRG